MAVIEAGRIAITFALYRKRLALSATVFGQELAFSNIIFLAALDSSTSGGNLFRVTCESLQSISFLTIECRLQHRYGIPAVLRLRRT